MIKFIFALLLFRPEPHAVAVYDYRDIQEIQVLPNTRVECPLHDGEIDRKNCVMSGSIVVFKPGHTWHYEIRK
jgi:hypothetical protein